MAEYQRLQKILREERETLKQELSADRDIYSRGYAPASVVEDWQKLKDDCKLYAEAVRLEIESKENKRFLATSRNLLAVEDAKFTLKQRISESKELIALKRAHLNEIDESIASFQKKIQDGQNILRQADEPARPPVEVTAEHIERARERFKHLKEELHRLIKAYFHNSDDFIALMGALIEAKKNGEMDVNVANHDIIAVNTLKTSGIVASHPYDKTKIRLIL